MYKDHFYHSTTKKIIQIFGRMLGNMKIVRYDSNGDESKRLTVPISYGARSAYLSRINTTTEHGKGSDTRISLPRIIFNMTDIAYDPDRSFNKYNYTSVEKDADTFKKMYTPAPYNIQFEVIILTHYQEDNFQIIEQILPMFRPDLSIKAEEVPDMGLTSDLRISFEGMSRDDNYDQQFTEQRIVTTTMSFTVEANYYGAIKEIPYIKTVQIDWLLPEGDVNDEAVRDATPRHYRETTQVDPITAGKNDEWTATKTTENFFDGKKYNPITGEDEEIS